MGQLFWALINLLWVVESKVTTHILNPFMMYLILSMSHPALFLIGLSFRIFVGWRQFRRRGVGGLQQFNNYFVGILTLLVEQLLQQIGRLLMIIAFLGWLL